MRYGLGSIREVTDEILVFARQLGATDVIVGAPNLPGEGYWEFMGLLHLRTRVEDAGLKLAAIENIPLPWYKKAILGQPGRDEQIENFQKTLRHMGKAGIPVLGYHWMANSVWRTSRTTPGRGDARVTSYDEALVKDAPLTEDREYTEEEVWNSYEYFLKAVVPVAEESGVRIAVHPADPPVPSLGGVARLHRSHAALRRTVETIPSDYNGLEF